jgi:hypothetical protein
VLQKWEFLDVSGVIREDRIKNEYVRDSIGVGSMVDERK